MAIELAPDQLDALRGLGNGRILCGSVGSGKSRIGLCYFMGKVVEAGIRINGVGEESRPARPRPLFIITTAKKRDTLEWERELALFGLSAGDGRPAVLRASAGDGPGALRGADGRSNAGGWLGAPVVIDSWNNLYKHKNTTGAFFIFDEQRLVGSGAWVKAFYRIARRNQWIVLTGTPGDVWTDYVPVFVANGFYRSKAEFLAQHAVYSPFSSYPKIVRFVDERRLEAYRERVVVVVDYVPHTKRHLITVPCEFDTDLMETVRKKRWNPWKDQPIKDAGELFRLMRRVVNSDTSRIRALEARLESSPRLIVFYNFNYERDMLLNFVTKRGVPFAEWNGHKHMALPTGERWLYLVQYTAGSEGWNCTSTDSVFFFSLTYSHKAFEQAQGRIDRRNTKFTDLYYYVARSNNEIDRAVWGALLRKKRFSEGAYIRKHKIGDEFCEDHA